MLINSVTSAMPIHLMQCTLLPAKICHEFDKINRNFLKGDSPSRKKIHAINWSTKPKHLSGLGIMHSLSRNKALLAKRVWELRLDPNSIWAKTFRKKYPPSLEATIRNLLSGQAHKKTIIFVRKAPAGSSVMEKPPSFGLTIGRVMANSVISLRGPST